MWFENNDVAVCQKLYIYTYWWWTSVIREYSSDFAIQCHISNSTIIVTIDPWALRIMKKKRTNKQTKQKQKQKNW